MNYYLYPPFFGIEPQTSFDDAWEVFCCELLNLEHSTHEIRRRTPPDLGADLIWDQKGIVYQCKSTKGSLNLSDIKKSIDKAKDNQRILCWHRYILCTNVYLTGDQEHKLREYLPSIEFLNCGYWTKLCRKFCEETEVSARFQFLTQGFQQDSAHAPSQIWGVPYLRNPFFTGQNDILNQLFNNLHISHAAASTQIQAISGLGGIGKTQIAVEYAYRYRDSYHAILWVKAATSETIIADFMKIANLVDLPKEIDQNQESVVNDVKQWLALHDNWLLFFDNADDLTLIHDFLPPGGKGHLILTTRDQAVGNLAKSIQVKELNKEDGMLLLLRRAKVLSLDALLTEASPQDLTTAEEIVGMLGALPLALDQAGAYIQEMRCGLLHYHELYQTRRAELLRRRSRLPSDHPEPVATTWSLSFQHIEQTDPIAAQLLCFCAFLQPDSIPEEIVVEGLSIFGLLLQRMINQGIEDNIFSIDEVLDICAFLYPEQPLERKSVIDRISVLGVKLEHTTNDLLRIDEAIGELLRFSLLQRDYNTQTLSIHRLVQSVLLDGMDDKTRQIRMITVVQAVNQVFPNRATPETWTLCRRYLPQAIVCIDFIRQYDLKAVEAARLLNVVGYYFQEHALYQGARHLYKNSLDIYEQLLGPNHPSTAIVLHELARLSLAEEKYSESEALFKRVISIYEQMQEPDILNVMRTFHEFARLLLAQERYQEAESILQYTLSIREKVLGPEHPDTVSTLHEIGIFFLRQRMYNEAESIFKNVLQIEERMLGLEHRDVAITLENLALVHLHQGRNEEAEPLLERAVSIYEKTLGSEHPKISGSLAGLATLYQTQGLHKKAMLLYERLLNIIRETQGPEHHDTIKILKILVNMYLNQDMDDKAIQMLQETIGIEEKLLRPNHLDIASMLQDLAMIYHLQPNYKEAQRLYDRALEIMENVPESNPLHKATVLYLLAILYQNQGDYEQAKSFYERTIGIRGSLLGLEHPETLIALEGYYIIQQRILENT